METQLRSRINDLEAELSTSRRDAVTNRELWNTELQRLSEENEALLNQSLEHREALSAEASLRQQLTAAEDDRRALQDNLAALQGQLEDRGADQNQQYERVLAQFTKEQRAREDADARLQLAQENNGVLKGEIEALQNALRRQQAQYKREQQSQKDEDEEKSQLLQLVALLEESNAKLRQDAEAARAAARRSKNAAPLQAAQLEALREANTRLATENDELREDIRSLQKQLAQANATIKRLTSQLRDAEESHAFTAQEANELRGALDDYRQTARRTEHSNPKHHSPSQTLFDSPQRRTRSGMSNGTGSGNEHGHVSFSAAPLSHSSPRPRDQSYASTAQQNVTLTTDDPNWSVMTVEQDRDGIPCPYCNRMFPVRVAK